MVGEFCAVNDLTGNEWFQRLSYVVRISCENGVASLRSDYPIGNCIC